MPVNVITIQKMYNDIVNLQIVPKELVQEIFGTDQAKQGEVIKEAKDRRLLSSSQEDSGKGLKMDSLLGDFKINYREISQVLMPLVMIAGAFSIVLTILTCCIKKFSRNLPKTVHKVLIGIKNKLMFNSILRYILQQFYKLSLATTLNIKFVLASASTVYSLFLSIPAALMLIGFTIFSYKFLERNKDKLSETQFKEKYGTLYVKVEVYNHT